jgi:hypothetical protein
MKEIPILFSTPMVQAILYDRKSQTRRVMKQQINDCDHSRYKEAEWRDKPTEWSEAALKIGRVYCALCGNGTEYSNDFGGIKCPYGKSGDLLWVRETWFPAAINADKVLIGYYDKDPANTIEIISDKTAFYWKQLNKGRMIPSIHMPKEAARIWLQVTDIRVDRLQDISEEDAREEGVQPAHCDSNENCPSSLCKEKCSAIGDWWNYLEPDGEGFPAYSAKESFETLWQSINGVESWAANPWVWVVSFEILSTTGKPIVIEEKAIS